MASEQPRRENVTDERKVEVEKDRVPKMTTHFESLAEKTREDQKDVNLRPVHQPETDPVRVVEVEGSAGKEAGKEKRTDSHHQMHTAGRPEEQQHQQTRGGGQGPSLEEISNMRATAQHYSAEAIMAADERYHKAKYGQTAADHHRQASEQKEDASSTKDGSLEDIILEKSQQAKDYTGQKAPEAKDALLTKGGALKETAKERSRQTKDCMQQKAPEVRDVLSSKGQSAAQFAAERAKAAKETTVDASKVAAEFVGEKANVTVESGKVAAGYAGKVASDVKDQAVVAGWGTTHYTLEKVADATKAAAGMTSSVAGYTKEKVAGAGQTIAGYAGEKLAAAKDAVVAAEEKAADYTARRKAEAQKDLDRRRISHEQQEAGEQLESPCEIAKESFKGVKEDAQKKQQGKGGGEGEQKSGEAGSGGTVFQAIGETIVEIGQTTKDLLVGRGYPIQVVEHREEVPHTGAGGDSDVLRQC